MLKKLMSLVNILMMKTSVLLITACLVAVFNSCSAKDVVKKMKSGKPAVKREFPFDVVIEVQSKTWPQLACGGSLIAKTWAMTSGRCCIHADSMDLYVGGDTHKLDNLQNFTVNHGNIHPHPEYASEAADNDICLIQLPSPATITEYVDIINLPPNSDAGPDTYEGKLVTSNGWGVTEDDIFHMDREMKYKKLKVMSNSECKETFGTNLTDNMFCTHKSTGGGLCKIGYGSHLMTQGTDGNPKVIGVVSDGSKCGNSRPFVYTQVAAYLDWINHVTGIPVE